MRIQVRDPKLWKRITDAVATFMPEGAFVCEEEGMRLRAMDPSQIVFLELSVPRSLFITYDVEPGERLPLDFVEYSKIMSRVQGDDVITMETEDTSVRITMEKRDGRLRRDFFLPLMDIPESPGVSVSPPFQMEARIKGRTLREALKDVSIFSNSVVMHGVGEKLVFESRGSQGGTRVIIRPGPNAEIRISEEVVSKFSVNFLQSMIREVESEDFVLLRLKADNPLNVEYRIGDARVSYYLAHMVL